MRKHIENLKMYLVSVFKYRKIRLIASTIYQALMFPISTHTDYIIFNISLCGKYELMAVEKKFREIHLSRVVFSLQQRLFLELNNNELNRVKKMFDDLNVPIQDIGITDFEFDDNDGLVAGYTSIPKIIDSGYSSLVDDALNKTLIKDSAFSVRLKNCLLAADFVTFGDVTNHFRNEMHGNENEFLKFRNFGKMSLQELKESGLLTKE